MLALAMHRFGLLLFFFFSFSVFFVLMLKEKIFSISPLTPLACGRPINFNTATNENNVEPFLLGSHFP
jgi:hypothetical protein